jgi:hypothetical protein
VPVAATTREQFRSSKGQSSPTIETGQSIAGAEVQTVVRVNVADSDGAGELIRLLVQMIEAEQVRFDAERRQVYIEVANGPDHALGRVLGVVEGWLGDGGRAPTEVEIDDHRYVLGAPQAAGESL